MNKLKPSNDRKVSTKSRWSIAKSGKRTAKPMVPNSFGLPALDSCPDWTEWCRNVCYAFNLQRAWSNVDNLVHHNLDLLKSCGSNVNKMVALLNEMVQSIDWKGTEKLFRWHWDGDIFSKPYAVAIAKTCQSNPDIQFWLYTRSFDFVPALLNIPNLAVYLSVDSFNIDKAKRLYNQYHPYLWIAACADTWEESETIMRDVVGRNAPRCPELTGKVPLVSENGVGACIDCGLCIYGRNHVRFASN